MYFRLTNRKRNGYDFRRGRGYREEENSRTTRKTTVNWQAKSAHSDRHHQTDWKHRVDDEGES